MWLRKQKKRDCHVKTKELVKTERKTEKMKVMEETLDYLQELREALGDKQVA